jgi:molybdopterin synthase catalytic subunit
MALTVLFFAGLAEAVGTRRAEFEHVPGDTVAAVRDRIIARFPVVSEFCPNLAYAVDEEYARDATPVPPGATVALIPPVSGGC